MMNHSTARKKITISAAISDKLVKVEAGDDSIEIYLNSPVIPNTIRLDFVVWFFLPIAMRCDADIFVQGVGSQETIENAQRMSQIWESWMPSHFSSVQVSFAQICQSIDNKTVENSLFFYSGGVDSTYSILNQNDQNRDRSLLTVHGMDYKYDDEKRFTELLEKTRPFAEKYSNKSLFVKTNAYSVYSKYKVNTKTTHVSHIFALAGAAFIFSEQFSSITIAADFRLDQQFAVHPWGSNSATNNLFNDGSTFLHTDGDEVTRAEKMALLLGSKEALVSLTFCKNYQVRPNNCGVCSKCTRTKLMFLGSTGFIPDIFEKLDIDGNPLICIDLNQKSERVFFAALYTCAKRNDRLDMMPYLQPAFERLKKIDMKLSSQQLSSTPLKKIKRKVFRLK